MNLRDYRWYRNPRGLHNIGVYRQFQMERYTRPQLGWAKLVAGGTEYTEVVRQLAQHNCMAIIRIFREGMAGMRVPDSWYTSYYKPYIEAGSYWFELYNEPNLDGEWPQAPGGGPAVSADWTNTDDCIRPLMDNWLEWAERIIELGGYPGFPALSESTEYRQATILWLDALLKYLKENHYTRFRRVIANGLWCATHPYLLNHFYQEPPGGPSHVARPYYQQRGSEPGWHFEYPYDPLQQRNDPGRTVFGGTALTPYGDPNGLIAVGEAFQQLLKRYFNAGPVPVIGTEGGIWRIPLRDEQPYLIDDRYPPYSYESHPEATMGMWRWIVEQGPPWFFGLTLWNEADYYDVQGIVPAIERMAAEPPLLKEVPNVETEGSPAESEPEEVVPVTVAPGPGPIIDSPDYHFLILAPGLQADWFFQAARRYWQTFRPTVMTKWDLIATLPQDKSLAVTVLARSDTIEYMNRRIRDTWPNVYYDPIVYDTLGEMQAELDRRATYQKRFG